MNTPSCRRAQELFADHREGSLDEVLRAELDAHLLGCPECQSLCQAYDEVVSALRAHPVLEPSAGLAERAAAGAVARSLLAPAAAPAWPRPLRLAAAVVLLASGALLLAPGPSALAAEKARRLTDRAGNALAYVGERRDRLLEDVRILRIVIGAAFEGRLDRVNDRFEDYRRLLERRSAAAAERKSGGNKQSNSGAADLVTRVESGKERSET